MERVVRPRHREIARDDSIRLRERLLAWCATFGKRLRGRRREPQDPAGAFDADLTSVPVDSVFHRAPSSNTKIVIIRAARRASVCQRTLGDVVLSQECANQFAKQRTAS